MPIRSCWSRPCCSCEPKNARHCERSEAIHGTAPLRPPWIASSPYGLLAMTMEKTAVNEPMLQLVGLSKRFVLHAQGAVELGVLDDLSLSLGRGECIALDGPSGIGKSTLLRTVYANYKADAGQIWLRHGGALIDLVAAPPRQILEVRRRTLGYI